VLGDEMEFLSAQLSDGTLSKQELLAAAKTEGISASEGSPFVFPGRTADVPLRKMGRLWDAVRHAARLTDVRLHDLRHSFASVSALGGDSLLVIGKLLGHRNARTTAKYAQLGDDLVKAAADRTGGTPAALLDGSDTAVRRSFRSNAPNARGGTSKSVANAQCLIVRTSGVRDGRRNAANLCARSGPNANPRSSGTSIGSPQKTTDPSTAVDASSCC
jgi:hypothetical protein